VTLELSSPAFDDGERIPEEYGYAERNVNPTLDIGGVPADAESPALVMHDPDAVEPAGTVRDHRVVRSVDSGRSRGPEDWAVADAAEGDNDHGERGYGGPNPPEREHTYRFRLHALDTVLDLASGATKADLEDAMAGHVVDDAELEGTYAP